MHSVILERSNEHAVNCLTGVYSKSAEKLGHFLPEHAIFSRGDGYLFQAGTDEQGSPEFTFPVEETGAAGVARSGFTLRQKSIRVDHLYDDLEVLLDSYQSAAVWVNTAFLGYAEVYSSNPPYLHAILIESIAPDHSGVFVLDTLIVGNTPQSATAFLSTSDLKAAITNEVHTESHGGMGYFYTIARSADSAVSEGDALKDQSRKFFADARFSNGVRQYRDLCFDAFEAKPLRSNAARRLFHHSSVLYLTPSLSLLSRALINLGGSGSLQDKNSQIIRHWQAMGVLALRFEATESPRVLDRIDERFELIRRATEEFWAELSEGSPFFPED